MSARLQTPVSLVQAVLLAYTQRGMDPAPALSKAQITPRQARSVRGSVTAAQFERLCAAAMHELDDEAPGWFSRRLPWGSYGMLARASISAPTLGVALARWCRHHGLLTEDVRLTLHTSSDQAHIDIAEHRDLGLLREFALLSLLRNLHGVACWLIDSQIPLQAAQFPFAAPPHAALYPALFPGPVQFNAPRAALQFDAQYLHQPLRRDGAALDHMLRRALPLMVWPYRRDRLLSLRVRQLLQQPTAAHTADTLAARLGLSTRSLHRQLSAEGASLQTLKDEVRRQRASELLLRTDWPIARVARAAGFASDKTFARAFRHWTGESPQAHRQNVSQVT
jgi:AraC-like DNA-binding protein